MTRTAPGKAKSCSDKVNEMLRAAALHKAAKKGPGINPRQFPPTLTFGRARSTQPHLQPARFDGYPARL
jgi:hypothetical protein